MTIRLPGRRVLLSARLGLFLGLIGPLAGGTGPARAAAPPRLPVDELVPGTVATAKTVFAGTRIDTFSVEIISVVHDIGPEQDLILARGLGERIERLGVAEGMSGSPVYVDGKLIGAVSSSWMFAREPLLGITPAEQMARESGGGAATGPSGSDLGTRDAGRDFLEGRAPAGPATNGPTPIRSPLVLSGFDRRLVTLAAELFEPWGFTVAEGGGAGAHETGGTIEAGATLGVRLAGGDVNMTAFGATTWLDEDEVYGWGHPFFQMGDVELPLVAGYVHAVIPSQIMSFKLASGGKTVGTALGDRRSGIYGRLGVEPPVTRFDLTLTRGGQTRAFTFDLGRNRYLTPNLLGLTAANALLTTGGLNADETVRFVQTLHLVDGRDTQVETVFAGDQTLMPVVDLLSEAARVLALNPFEDVLLDRVEAELTFSPEIRLGVLTEAGVDRARCEPGDVVRGSFTIRDWRGGESVHRFEIPLPENAREGRYLLLVADARTAEEYEAERDPRSYAPRSLDELLARIRRLRATDEAHVLLYRQSRGVLIDGRPFADLPPSALSVMRRAARSGNQGELPAERVHETRVPLDRLVQGAHTLLLEVRKEKP